MLETSEAFPAPNDWIDIWMETDSSAVDRPSTQKKSACRLEPKTKLFHLAAEDTSEL